jgi:hypothetical protein
VFGEVILRINISFFHFNKRALNAYCQGKDIWYLSYFARDIQKREPSRETWDKLRGLCQRLVFELHSGKCMLLAKDELTPLIP